MSSLSARELILRFLELEGHRAEVEVAEGNPGEALIRLRSRGHVISIGTSERDPRYYSVSTAFEMPNFARDPEGSAPLLVDLQATFKAVKFFYAGRGSTLIVAVEQFSSSPEEFTSHLWRIVGILREAGEAAVARVRDGGASKAAAEKFINEFMRGQGR